MPPGIEAGRYIAVHTGTWSGSVIDLFTRSKFDHVMISLGDGTVVEATPRGVHISPLSNYAGHLAVANLGEPVTDAQRETVAATARSMTGRGYAFTDIGVIGLRLLGIKWGWLLRVARYRGAVICSELAAICGKAAGLDWLCGEPDVAYVEPGELARRPGTEPVSL